MSTVRRLTSRSYWIASSPSGRSTWHKSVRPVGSLTGQHASVLDWDSFSKSGSLGGRGLVSELVSSHYTLYSS